MDTTFSTPESFTESPFSMDTTFSTPESFTESPFSMDTTENTTSNDNGSASQPSSTEVSVTYSSISPGYDTEDSANISPVTTSSTSTVISSDTTSTSTLTPTITPSLRFDNLTQVILKFRIYTTEEINQTLLYDLRHALRPPNENQISLFHLSSSIVKELKEIIATIRFYNSDTQTAEKLYDNFVKQLQDSNSILKNGSITSRLNLDSIIEKKILYICSSQDSQATQETPCGSTTSPNRSIIVAAVVPSVIIFLLILCLVIFLFVRHKKRQQTPSFSRRKRV
ncbi:unnamed protein product [Didymodactylos carnosus]|uniref:Uncharacterized protein n=1 Tax=Didymodactylos carnosus TaxID=1234261 RepID=A0A814V2B2_9BILA|nr:unnamed protein product [Didymodactylos carnosus]CAF1181618.1 unnamed protein product [Didymodactylos carnosus]CAF3850555.1 unnamed protein product [Didymodactylos carnosus]CAF3945915.1 unnamed protein product [Didymodactylos carnosus]